MERIWFPPLSHRILYEQQRNSPFGYVPKAFILLAFHQKRYCWLKRIVIKDPEGHLVLGGKTSNTDYVIRCTIFIQEEKRLFLLNLQSSTYDVGVPFFVPGETILSVGETGHDTD